MKSSGNHILVALVNNVAQAIPLSGSQDIPQILKWLQEGSPNLENLTSEVPKWAHSVAANLGGGSPSWAILPEPATSQREPELPLSDKAFLEILGRKLDSLDEYESRLHFDRLVLLVGEGSKHILEWLPGYLKASLRLLQETYLLDLKFQIFVEGSDCDDTRPLFHRAGPGEILLCRRGRLLKKIDLDGARDHRAEFVNILTEIVHQQAAEWMTYDSVGAWLDRVTPHTRAAYQSSPWTLYTLTRLFRELTAVGIQIGGIQDFLPRVLPFHPKDELKKIEDAVLEERLCDSCNNGRHPILRLEITSELESALVSVLDRGGLLMDSFINSLREELSENSGTLVVGSRRLARALRAKCRCRLVLAEEQIPVGHPLESLPPLKLSSLSWPPA